MRCLKRARAKFRAYTNDLSISIAAQRGAAQRTSAHVFRVYANLNDQHRRHSESNCLQYERSTVEAAAAVVGGEGPEKSYSDVTRARER